MAFNKISENFWKQRKQKMIEIFKDLNKNKNSNYDCLIPVSGGKDSTYQAYFVKKEFGLNPLLVNFIPRDLVPLGRKNIENLKFDSNQIKKVSRQLIYIFENSLNVKTIKTKNLYAKSEPFPEEKDSTFIIKTLKSEPG